LSIFMVKLESRHMTTTVLMRHKTYQQLSIKLYSCVSYCDFLIALIYSSLAKETNLMSVSKKTLERKKQQQKWKCCRLGSIELFKM
jgi:hypothetical protein